MITKVVSVNSSYFEDGSYCRRSEYYGKSGDIKPTDGVRNADAFYEMDTKKVYLFDEETSTWLEQ